MITCRTWVQLGLGPKPRPMVLPVAGGMNEDEIEEEEVTGVVDDDMIDEIDV